VNYIEISILIYIVVDNRPCWLGVVSALKFRLPYLVLPIDQKYLTFLRIYFMSLNAIILYLNAIMTLQITSIIYVCAMLLHEMQNVKLFMQNVFSLISLKRVVVQKLENITFLFVVKDCGTRTSGGNSKFLVCCFDKKIILHFLR